ncbi:MAG TPA: hypothetical protein VNM34_04165, partial [Verrucomicrobiae bacterium]|nr:hypothetical protein [Verrucomicrobiae bacterium]
PLGILGLSAGLFTLGGALGQGISKATEMGKAASRLSAMTGLATETTSALSAAFDHFGIGVDKQIRLVGFLEKNVGLLAARKGAIADFEKTFGLALTDANGKLKDANELILTSADYFNNKSIPATTKAAALAKIYGRAWQDLIPILSAGRAGIQGAEEEAAKFGLTLTKDNIGALTRLREATRNWGTALGGLEVQIGLLVVGPLTDLAKFGTEFIAKNRQGIQQFFQNLIKTAQGFAAFVTGTVVPTLVSIGTAAKSAWNAVPAPLRDLLVKGFIADKAVKFLFGFSPIKFATDALGGLAKSFFGRGGNPAMPLFVADVTGGLGRGAAGGAAGGAGGLIKSGVQFILPIGLGILIANAIREAAGLTPEESAARQNTGQFGPRSAGNVPTTGPSDRGLDSAALHGMLADQRGIFDKLGSSIQYSVNSVLHALGKEFSDMEHTLRTARGTDAVAKAVAAAVALVVGKGRGNVAGTESVLADLKHQLANTHDPKLQTALRDAIHKVEQKVVGREFVAKQIVAADKIAKSTESTKQKVADLTAIQKTLEGRSTKAIEVVQKKIDAAKAAQVAAANKTTAAGWGTARAIQEKDLSVTVNNNVSIRDIYNGQKKISRVFATVS